MGRFTRIERTINSQLDSGQVKVVQRGLPYFVDQLLRGQVRFAKRTGNNNAVLNADNTFKITEPAAAGQDFVFIEKNTDWITLGSFVSLGPDRELLEVEDVIGKQVRFKGNTRFGYTTEQELLLHSVPMLANTAAGQGATSLEVRTRFPLGNGDVFAYLSTDGFMQSITETRIERAVYSGLTADPTHKLLYTIHLEKPVTKSVQMDEVVYLRAYPGYFSRPVKIPNNFSSTSPMGPLLIDYLSGRLVEGFAPKETFSIRLLDRSGTHQLGSPFEYVTVNKNYPVLKRPINTQTFVFFNPIAGDTKFTPSRVVMEVSEGKYRISQPLVPSLDFAGLKYMFSTSCNTDGKLVIYLDPHPPIVLTIEPKNQSHVITLPHGESNNMEIVLVTDTPRGRLLMSDWTQVGPQIDKVEYSVIVEATGRGRFQSTGLIVKPFFLTLETLSGRYDKGDNYDSGSVYL